jgi:sigma-B regulation protein RsbU (phosphoserine phosphatase)
MANLQALLRVVAPTASSPADACRKLNRHLHQVTDASRFATFFYAEWWPAERRLRYVNAGHNTPLLLGPSRGLRLDRGGIPLGIMPEPEYETGEVFLQRNDLLILYSDGITEAGLAEGEEFGEMRLRALVEEAQDKPVTEIRRRVIDAVRVWAGKDPEDDMTLVVIRMLGAEAAADACLTASTTAL